MRLFAAVVPPSDVAEHLAAFLEPRRDAGREAGLRWSPVDQWHVTLAFAADADEHRLDDLLERLGSAAARVPAFGLRLAGGFAFPDAARARVLVADLDRPEDAGDRLDRLARGARTAFATAGVEVDGTRFRPHLTLARRNRPSDVTSWVRLLEAYAGPAFDVDRVVLVASHLGEGPRGRPRHEPLAEVPLAPPRGPAQSTTP